ncbi:hypothetical protein NEOLEDRAFT_1208459 [Neolentinus lepideus HHB14362 ss-1]|uniref:Uncharacterized protein n=1 Tax=Neolentinus lepideus HHB14362 ss-1 TaxID=1314782 RepID=A0A165VFT6_9AGAM|nr:hypothetical protein NEOLEDRAFT_1208459 [Neolentinus lepideus HHB14362 ss-1]
MSIAPIKNATANSDFLFFLSNLLRFWIYNVHLPDGPPPLFLQLLRTLRVLLLVMSCGHGTVASLFHGLRVMTNDQSFYGRDLTLRLLKDRGGREVNHVSEQHIADHGSGDVLSIQFKADPIQFWYSPNASSTFQEPIARFFCIDIANAQATESSGTILIAAENNTSRMCQSVGIYLLRGGCWIRYRGKVSTAGTQQPSRMSGPHVRADESWELTN